MRKRILIRVFWFLLLGLIFTPLWGQVSFEARVSKKKLGLNERLRVDFVMNQNGDNFTPPKFDGFRIMGGPNQSISNSYINGKRSFSKSFTYFLSPMRKGQLTIQQATVQMEGEIYKTTPVHVQVTEAVAVPKDPNSVEYLVEQNMHLVTEVSNLNPYLNERVTILYKLYFRNPVKISEAPRELESPKFVDFWSQNIKIPQLRIEQDTYKGEPYNVVVWRKTVLYPQKTGKLALEPLTLNVLAELPTNRRDFFGDRIMRTVNKVVTTGQTNLQVKPLPIQGQPEDFSGAVGDFNFDVLLNKTSLKASESFQARIKVTGTGNLKLFDLPKLRLPNTLEVYEPEHEEDVKVNLKGMQGLIQDNYTIVPQYQGKYPIAPISFSYFNPKTGTYARILSKDFIVNVFEGPLAQTSSTPKPSATNIINSPNAKFGFIQLQADWQPIDKSSFWGSRLYYLLLILPIVLLLIGIPLLRWIAGRRPDALSQKQKAASRLARKYLGTAKKTIGDKSRFYEALEAALHNYLRAKLKIETQDFNKDKIIATLLDRGIATETTNDFVQLLQNCEKARFAPSSEVQINQDYQNAVRIITQLDRKL